MDRKINIGLVGFGCVGQALYDAVQAESLPFEISRICVKDRSKQRSIPIGNFTFRYQDLLEDDKIGVIVELIDDSDTAFYMVKEALIAGKKVVTANKKMVAEHLEELMAFKDNGGKLWYEAAVCGSIPIVKTLDQFYNHEPIQEISGIFNGSSNFILTRIEQDGLDYQQALKQAQELGFAESDPLLDVGGYDSLNKLVILLCHAYGIATSPSSLCNIGIQNLNHEDLEFAREFGFKIKLAAISIRRGNQVHAYVIPCFVEDHHQLSHVNDEFNAVLVKGKYTGDHLFTGKGAGGAPTAASVIADIYATTEKQDYDYYKWHDSRELVYDNDVTIPIYLRYRTSNELAEFGFEQIWREGRYGQGGYVVGTISLTNLWSLNSYIEERAIAVISGGLLQGTMARNKQESEESLIV